MRAALAGSVLAVATAAGCFSSAVEEDCRTDRDCGDLVCTRVGDCAASSNVYQLRVEWTVRGLEADAAGACSSVGELEIAVEDPTTDDQHVVRPVPCNAGVFFYDKLPVGFTEVTVSAFSTTGAFLDSRRASALGAAGVVRIALLP